MSLAECVERMFSNAGIRPHVDGNKYLTEVHARHCVFTPALMAEGNRLSDRDAESAADVNHELAGEVGV